MNAAQCAQLKPSLLASGVWALAVVVACLTGCVAPIGRISCARNAVPVREAPPALLTDARPSDTPIDFRLLGQRPRDTHVIDSGDMLGILVEGVLPTKELTLPKIPTNNISSPFMYPATGQIYGPVVGVPTMVDDAGRIAIPLVEPLAVRGMTLTQAAEVIRHTYVVDHKILQPGRDRVIVTIIKPRVHRVMVIREDLNVDGFPSYVSHGVVPYTKRPTSLIVDLPTHENDVLHALVVSGGQPGIDAHCDLWVLRGRADVVRALPADEPGETAAAPQNMASVPTPGVRTARIPLRLRTGEPLPFIEQDIVLDDGDIVFVPARDTEWFYTGGLLVGGQFPLPRDRSLDVIEAIAMANGTPGGPAGLNGARRNFNNGTLGGIVDPTQILVVRKLPNGEQVKIAVDLSLAAHDSRERLVIQPDDLVMLEYKPLEYMANAAMSFVTPSAMLLVSNSNQSNAAVASTATATHGATAVPPNAGTNPGINPTAPPVTTTSP